MLFNVWQVYHPHARDDNLLGDYCDSEHFKQHELFGNDPHALQLLLYFDEVEVCNPLGSRANKHKLGMYVLCCIFCVSSNLHHCHPVVPP